MKVDMSFWGILFYFLVFCSQSFASQDLSVVSNFDPKEMSGLWYDIAHSSNFFQNFCDRSTAEYAFQSELQISVQLTCYRNQKILSHSQGLATIINPNEPAKLFVDVRYLPRGDYWIVKIDPEHLWAVMSSPDRSKLFILARYAPMEPVLKFAILRDLQLNGFDIGGLVFDKY